MASMHLVWIGMSGSVFEWRETGKFRNINFYVTRSGTLSRHSSSVQLWHGAEDSLSPLAMATDLANRIPGAASVEELKGGSHYSCLYAAAPNICALLAAE